jgi:hypothetical protein
MLVEVTAKPLEFAGGSQQVLKDIDSAPNTS